MIYATRVLILAAFFATWSDEVIAQGSFGESRRQTTRPELEAAAKASEEAAAATRDPKLRQRYLAESAQRRQRLKNGDFAPGDRILLQVYGDSALSDTFTVRIDRVLRVPNIPDIPLAGVLDSELEPYLKTSLGKYLREPQVTATALVRLGVLGAVGHPGFLTVPVDQALSDVLMNAGGLANGSDLSRTEAKRGTTTVLDKNAFRDALRLGLTVGDVAMRDGDQIIVPDKLAKTGITQWLAVVSAAAGLLWSISWAARR